LDRVYITVLYLVATRKMPAIGVQRKSTLHARVVLAAALLSVLGTPCLCTLPDTVGSTDAEGESISREAASAKFIKIEKMRHRHFSPMAGETRNTGILDAASTTIQRRNHHAEDEPVRQIALFREENRKRVADKVTRIVEASRNKELARQMARDRMEKRANEATDHWE
jgi:hypothetical protein